MVTEMSESKNLLNNKSELSSEEKFEILVFDVLYNSAVAQSPLVPDKSQIVLVDKVTIQLARSNEESRKITIQRIRSSGGVLKITIQRTRSSEESRKITIQRTRSSSEVSKSVYKQMLTDGRTDGRTDRRADGSADNIRTHREMCAYKNRRWTPY
ncbi:hypothetical protein LOTGIDRAFT_173389 [Lottia gigantea]|uniref:Uncharacterized protein n=1 Tax=Lottia gigantea TaxID=225164 RepID=V4ASH6_LOTGI|nr:hypothetical protein LOTGIDRAFT_173389 [Lottia gigantea]ESP00228.1 hypothetical protein LOTGIDRAFT_173389 [Lottia gigantea]